LTARGGDGVLDACRRCGQFAKCNVRDPLWRISDIIVAALSKTMVSELTNDVNPVASAAPVSLVPAPVRA
jgi:hypothetical protein